MSLLRNKKILYPLLVAAAIAVFVVVMLCVKGAKRVEPTETESTTKKAMFGPYDPLNFSLKDGHYVYEDDRYVSIVGIDVSSYQEDIDWQTVAASGVSFAYVRAGYRGYMSGDLHEDEYLGRNIHGAVAAGLDVGVYFYSQAVSEDEAREEARFTAELIGGAGTTLPVCFDFETAPEDDARTAELTNAQRTAITKAFCDEIKKLGYEPIVYANLHWLDTKTYPEELSEYALWFAGYYSPDDNPYVFDIWQFTDSGSVPGVYGPVDLDLMFVEKGAEPSVLSSEFQGSSKP